MSQRDYELELVPTKDLIDEVAKRCAAIVLTCRFHADNNDLASYVSLSLLDGDSALCYAFAKKLAEDAEAVFFSAPIQFEEPDEPDQD